MCVCGGGGAWGRGGGKRALAPHIVTSTHQPSDDLCGAAHALMLPHFNQQQPAQRRIVLSIGAATRHCNVAGGRPLLLCTAAALTDIRLT